MNISGEISDEMRAAAQFFAGKLMDGRLHRHIYLEILNDVNFQFAGDCVCDDDSLTPRFFIIRINPAAHDHVLLCLAHEMVHLKQFANGEIRYHDRGKVWWHGEIYAGVQTLIEYGADVDLPWEEEAYGREWDLYEDWLSLEVKN